MSVAREDERNIRTAYANVCRINLTPEEIILQFGMETTDDLLKRELTVFLSNRVILNPMTAKRLSLVLHQALANYVPVVPTGAMGPTVPLAPMVATAPIRPRTGTLTVLPAAPDATGEVKPILAKMQGVSEQARLPLCLVAELGAGYLLGGSFKMFDGTLLGDRFLVTLTKERIAEPRDEKVLEMCRRMGMPAALLTSFAEKLPPANYVHVGFEANERASIYKVYLEYWTTWEQEIEVKRISEPFVGGFGFKWDVADARRTAVTRYTCHPRLSVEGLLQRVAAVCDRPGGDKPVDVTRCLLEAATARIDTDKILYLETDERDNPRRSFDINMLRARVLLSELYPVWQDACRRYAVSTEAFNALFTPIRNELFSHIQGGVDREGRDFITIYYGAEAH